MYRENFNINSNKEEKKEITFLQKCKNKIKCVFDIHECYFSCPIGRLEKAAQKAAGFPDYYDLFYSCIARCNHCKYTIDLETEIDLIKVLDCEQYYNFRSFYRKVESLWINKEIDFNDFNQHKEIKDK